MTSKPTWRQFVEAEFPAYLLPKSHLHAIDEEAAARFLARTGGKAHQLQLLRSASLFSTRLERLRQLAFRDLPALVRVLPSQTRTIRRTFDGGFTGRLDAKATLAWRLAGNSTRFVTVQRKRHFELDETILVKAVAERLLSLATDLRQAHVIDRYGWGEAILDCEAQLRHLLTATRLREVPTERPTGRHLMAARSARHVCYEQAAWWFNEMGRVMDDSDPAQLAKIIAAGALRPLDDSTLFEIAVTIRLVQALWNHLTEREPDCWSLELALVLPGRKDVATFRRLNDNTQVRVYYNQSILDPGARDLGVEHYLASSSRLRPDVICRVERPGAEPRAVVIEVKLSEDPSYVAQGYSEAVLYRWEYAPQLSGWPKSILVTSATVKQPPRSSDEVIAVGWDRWVPADVAAGIMGQLSR